MLKLNKKGQNTAEYAILIGLVVAVVIAMQTYVKRGVQGRMHDATNKYYNDIRSADWSQINPAQITDAFNQYEPTELESLTTQQRLAGSQEKTHIDQGGVTTRTSKEITQQATGDYQKSTY